MASSIRYKTRPDLRHPVIIEGLPGVGNVGKLAADLIAKKLNAVHFADIASSDLPPQILVDDDCVVKNLRNELWAADAGEYDIVFILGDAQATTPSGQHDLTEFTLRALLPYDPSMIITLGGYGIGNLPVEPRVLGTVTDAALKERFESAGVGFYPGEPKGGIVGAAAMFLVFGEDYGIPSACIMGETSGYIVDYRSAKYVIQSLCAILGVDVDTSDYDESVTVIENASDAPPEDAVQAPAEDLSYIR